MPEAVHVVPVEVTGAPVAEFKVNVTVRVEQVVFTTEAEK